MYSLEEVAIEMSLGEKWNLPYGSTLLKIFTITQFCGILTKLCKSRILILIIISICNLFDILNWIVLHIYRFFVDDVPIRTYNRKNEATFPTRPMWVYGSIWDASDWATENGRIKADYRYQPFVAKYKNFKLAGCTADSSSSCRPPSPAPFGNQGLSRQQMAAMAWAQRNFLVYNYCHDPKRDHTQTPEC